MSTTYPIYLRYVFGQDSDALTPFDMATDPDNGISMQQGYTAPYQYNLNTNPEALPISRGQFNYLANVLAANIQQYQQVGFPAWITADQNGGVAFPYQINSTVIYGGLIYQNLVLNNTATPGTNSSWLNVSANIDGVQVGMTIMWPCPGAPIGSYLFSDGSAVSRTTYATLDAALNQKQIGVVTNTDATVTGLVTADMFAGMDIECSAFAPGTTIADVVNSTSVTMSTTATAGGSLSIQFFQEGNGDGSTTFNIPDMRTYVPAGSGGSGVSFGSETVNVVGESVGDQTYMQQLTDLAPHTHDKPNGNGFIIGGASGIGYGSSGNQFGQTAITGGITGGTSQTAMPLVQPTKLAKFFIKYQ